ncbi:hypothetical protein [Brevibacillus reuszeri]|uniref:hypothetical protein n=1 Tax=Brevibacillus reuszeri TaxID=54915 RepID=UPI001BB3CDBF|nr:hypothetical protein [Brevibacillus reuszeri]
MQNYLPLNTNPGMTALFTGNISGLIGEDNIESCTTSGGSTEMGDISCIMPAIHPYICGFSGMANNRKAKPSYRQTWFRFLP